MAFVVAGVAALGGIAGGFLFRRNMKELQELREYYDETIGEPSTSVQQDLTRTFLGFMIIGVQTGESREYSMKSVVTLFTNIGWT